MVTAPRSPGGEVLFSLLLLLFAGFVAGNIYPVMAAPGSVAAQDNATLAVGSAYGVGGVVLWLAADSGVTMDKDGNVSSLTDKTGNFILTASNPDLQPLYVPNVLNGKPVLRFNPDQSLYSDDDFGTDLNHAMTMIVLAKTDASRTLFQYPIYLGQNRSSHANRALAYYEGKQVFDGQWVGFYGPQVVRSSFIAIGISINATLTKATFYQNGAQMMVSDLSNENGKAMFENLSHGVTLGAAADPCRGWLGDIAEILVFDRQLSPSEMEVTWSSLAAKYGVLQAAAPSSSISPSR
jgi:hypothetical protein